MVIMVALPEFSLRAVTQPASLKPTHLPRAFLRKLRVDEIESRGLLSFFHTSDVISWQEERSAASQIDIVRCETTTTRGVRAALF